MEWQIEMETPEWTPRARKKIKQAKRYVRINGEIFLYELKAPFVSSGCSISGGIEYRKYDDTLKCHECGDWYKNLGLHSRNSHGLTAEQYKQKHGMRRKTSLVCERMREVCIKNMVSLNAANGGSPVNQDPQLRERANNALVAAGRGARRSKLTDETRNSKMLCQAQVMARVKDLADSLGRTPSVADLREADLSVSQVMFSLGCSTATDAMAMCGLVPNRKGESPFTGYTEEMCFALLEAFLSSKGRRPTCSDQNRGLFPPRSVLARLFGGGVGSLIKAYESK